MRAPAAWKTEEVKLLGKMINDAEITAIVGVHGIRNKQLQNIRRNIRNSATIRVVRRKLLFKALDAIEQPELHKLKDISLGQVALMTAKMSPNEIYEVVKATEQDSAARGGEIAPEDIVIEAMGTQFPPGPMISEFQKVGLQTAIEKGKIAIKKETVFVKQGEVIPKDKAKILEKLEIHPLRVGLDLLGAYSDGIFYPKDVISETLSDISRKFARAFGQAKSVALDAGFIIPEIVPDLLVKARLGAEHLALETGFVDESSIQLFILKAIKDAAALNASIGGEEVEETKGAEETKKEPKEEEGSSDDDVSAGLGALFG